MTEHTKYLSQLQEHLADPNTAKEDLQKLLGDIHAARTSGTLDDASFGKIEDALQALPSDRFDALQEQMADDRNVSRMLEGMEDRLSHLESGIAGAKTMINSAGKAYKDAKEHPVAGPALEATESAAETLMEGGKVIMDGVATGSVEVGKGVLALGEEALEGAQEKIERHGAVITLAGAIGIGALMLQALSSKNTDGTPKKGILRSILKWTGVTTAISLFLAYYNRNAVTAGPTEQPANTQRQSAQRQPAPQEQAEVNTEENDGDLMNGEKLTINGKDYVLRIQEDRTVVLHNGTEEKRWKIQSQTLPDIVMPDMKSARLDPEGAVITGKAFGKEATRKITKAEYERIFAEVAESTGDVTITANTTALDGKPFPIDLLFKAQ